MIAPSAALGIAVAQLAEHWQLLSQALLMPSGLALAAAAAVGLLLVALLARSAWLGGPVAAGPLRQRASALRRKSWGAVYQRQLNPDAAGHVRPRAPSAAPAAAKQ